MKTSRATLDKIQSSNWLNQKQTLVSIKSSSNKYIVVDVWKLHKKMYTNDVRIFCSMEMSLVLPGDKDIV